MIGADRNYQASRLFLPCVCQSLMTFDRYHSVIWPMLALSLVFIVPTVLDKTCMFTVFTERDGKPWTHSVKALQIIWNHFPQLYACNGTDVTDSI